MKPDQIANELLKWGNGQSKESAILQCKRIIANMETRADKYGFTPNDLEKLRNHQAALKILQDK